MLPVFLALSIWGMALVGWGAVTQGFFFEGMKGARQTARTSDDVEPTLLGLSGLMTISVIGTLLNFVFALTPWLSAGVAAIGIGLFFRKGREVLRHVPPFEATVLSLVLLFLAFVASGPVAFYDTGLYHLQAVMWSTSGPVPLGLANLHRRLGLNSSWFPAAALLELPGFEGRSPSLAAPLVLLFFGAGVLSAMRRCARGEVTLSRLFLSLGVLPFFLFSADTSVPSLSTDLPVAVLTILSAYFLIRRGENPADAIAPRAAVVLALFASTVKLSAGAWLLACIVVVRVLPLASSAALLLPWLARGVALSGCLLYPSLSTRIGTLPWAVAPAPARDEVTWAQSWARLPGGNPQEALRGWAWVTPWLKGNAVRPSILPLLAMAAAGIGFLVFAARTRRAGRELRTRAVLVPAFIAAFSSVFWFLSAPDTRFAWGSLFTLAALPLAAGLRAAGFTTWSPARRRAVFTFSAGSLFVVGLAIDLRRGGQTLLSRPPLFVPRVVGAKTPEGVTVHRPAEGDRCGAAPLPCTPYFEPALKIGLSPHGRPRRFTLPSGESRRTPPFV